MTPLLSNTLLRAQSDERLVRLAAAGHDRAFEAIVERYRKPLLRFVRRMLPDGRAEDVVQATFVSAWASLRDGAEVLELRPWLYRIAHNGAINVLKRAGEHHDELGDSLRMVTGTEAAVEQRDDVRRTLQAVAGLPDRQRAALLAVAVDGRPHADVAEELGVSDAALRQLVHRARTALRTVATALTPSPLAAAALAGSGSPDRIAEVAAGAGGAGVAASAMKAGAVVVAAGALVAGAPQLANREEHTRPRHREVTVGATAPPGRVALPAADPARAAQVALEEKSPGDSARHLGGPRPGSVASPGDDHGATSGPSGRSGEGEATSGADPREGSRAVTHQSASGETESRHDGPSAVTPSPAIGSLAGTSGSGDDRTSGSSAHSALTGDGSGTGGSVSHDSSRSADDG